MVVCGKITKACIFDRKGTLPSTFSKWSTLSMRVDCKEDDADFPSSVAHEAAKYGTLPANFGTGESSKAWEMRDHVDRTVAHVAAEYGNLPSNFNQWELATKVGWTVAHEAATMFIPDSFSKWDMTDMYGISVVMIAAAHNNLPATFDQWDMMDGSSGQTVAHAVVAAHCFLPESFDKWDMRAVLSTCRRIMTVALAAYIEGVLPRHFDQWDMREDADDSYTMLERIITRPQESKIDFNKLWETERPRCATKADWDVFKRLLPEVYMKYSTSEHMDASCECALTVSM
jgi:hypothetical protein